MTQRRIDPVPQRPQGSTVWEFCSARKSVGRSEFWAEPCHPQSHLSLGRFSASPCVASLKSLCTEPASHIADTEWERLYCRHHSKSSLSCRPGQGEYPPERSSWHLSWACDELPRGGKKKKITHLWERKFSWGCGPTVLDELVVQGG